MDLEIIILSEISQKEKDKYHYLCVEPKMWNKLIKLSFEFHKLFDNLWKRNRIMGVENRLVVASEEGVGGGMKWGWG